jgi:hypothetical protein
MCTYFELSVNLKAPMFNCEVNFNRSHIKFDVVGPFIMWNYFI